jgi:hypothetical protein
MEDDELCSVCPTYHAQRRPSTLEFRLPLPPPDKTAAGDGSAGRAVEDEFSFTEPAEVLRQAQVRDEKLNQYERDLETMKDRCLYCQVEGRSFEYVAMACARCFDWIRAKKKALQDCQSKEKEWMNPHPVCWKCYQP